jgi:hypothetical protein
LPVEPVALAHAERIPGAGPAIAYGSAVNDEEKET